MAMIHVREETATPDHEPANGLKTNDLEIQSGDFVTREASGGCHLTDPANDAAADGIVPARERGDHLPEHGEDYTEPYYEGDGTFDNSDLCPLFRLEDAAVVHGWSIKDDTATAPAINKNDDVGIIMGPGNDPVLVEEGYTDDFSGTSTTYNETNGNFIEIGQADAQITDYETLTPVRIDK